MLKCECFSIRGADTSRPQQAVLVPSGLWGDSWSPWSVQQHQPEGCQGLLVPVGFGPIGHASTRSLHFRLPAWPMLGKAAREGWGCSLPKPQFWGLSWPLLLGRRGCSPQPWAARGRSDTWALSQALSVFCFCIGVLQRVLQQDLGPPALLPWLSVCPVPSPQYSRGG